MSGTCRRRSRRRWAGRAFHARSEDEGRYSASGRGGAEGVQVIELGREGVWDAGDSDWTKGRTHRKASHGSRGAQCRV